MPSANPSDRRKPWEEKNALISGVLAYLIPGAGHFYQGRNFKGVIYFVCILSTFFGGMRLGEGAVVYRLPNKPWALSLNYIAQVCVGLPAVPALIQSKRAANPENRDLYELAAPLKAPFQGTLITTAPSGVTRDGTVVGEIELATATDGPLQETRGTFRGTLNGEPVEWNLVGDFMLERPISAGFQRPLEIALARQLDQHPHETRLLKGSIPRSFIDAYCAPPKPEKLQDLNSRLGKFYDVAIAFTVIAGLLNVLAIWDAIEGPAYGFGDEVAPVEEAPKEGATNAAAAAAPPNREAVSS